MNIRSRLDRIERKVSPPKRIIFNLVIIDPTTRTVIYPATENNRPATEAELGNAIKWPIGE